MKKYYFLIVLALILGLVLTGCSLLSNISQVPTTGQSGVSYLTKTVPLSADLVGLWRFNGNADDSSGNELDGTVTGADYVDGVSGQALYFDGGDYVMVPNSSLLEPSEITVEAWVKRNGSPGSCKYIVSKYLPDKYGSYSSYGLYTGSGGIRFYIGYSGSWIGSPQASALVVWDGEWHHVAGTFDGLEVKLYVDKELVVGATSTSQDIYYEGTGNLYIGAYTNSSFLAFSGIIDEVRIWNGALLPEQLDSVIYDWDGFFRPVDDLPMLNAAKAGSAIPVKFSLNGDQGLDIFAAGYPKSVMIPCESTDLLSGIDETVTAGSSSLSYDDDQYIYVWKTEKFWAGTCRQLVVKLIDGTYHRANFTFK